MGLFARKKNYSFESRNNVIPFPRGYRQKIPIMTKIQWTIVGFLSGVLATLVLLEFLHRG